MSILSSRTLAKSISPRTCNPLLASTSTLPLPFTSRVAPSFGCHAYSTAVGSSSFKKPGKKSGKPSRWEIRKNRPRVFKCFQPFPPKSLEDPIFQEPSELSGLVPISRDTFGKEPVGSIVQLKTDKNGLLATYGTPKNVLVDFRLLSQSCTVVRSATKHLMTTLNFAKGKSSLETRLVLTGSSGCGKSVLMLQMASQCLADGWIVLYIPRANKLIDSSTPYQYDPKTQTYLQPSYSRFLLKRFRDVNAVLLHTIKLPADHPFDPSLSIKPNASLREAIDVALNDVPKAPFSLIATLGVLGKQTQHPVLFAVDDFQSLYGKSEYRNPQYRPIDSYHLSAPRLILEYANGRRKFAKGAFLGAVSMQNTQHPMPIELREGLKLPEDFPTPYAKRSPELMRYTEGLRAYHLPEKLGHPEASAIFELWTKDKAMHTYANDEMFLSKYAEASGNPRDFVHRGLLGALQT